MDDNNKVIELRKQLQALQEKVISYQEMYLSLKRKARKAKREDPDRPEEDEDDGSDSAIEPELLNGAIGVDANNNSGKDMSNEAAEAIVKEKPPLIHRPSVVDDYKPSEFEDNWHQAEGEPEPEDDEEVNETACLEQMKAKPSPPEEGEAVVKAMLKVQHLRRKQSEIKDRVIAEQLQRQYEEEVKAEEEKRKAREEEDFKLAQQYEQQIQAEMLAEVKSQRKRLKEARKLEKQKKKELDSALNRIAEKLPGQLDKDTEGQTPKTKLRSDSHVSRHLQHMLHRVKQEEDEKRDAKKKAKSARTLNVRNQDNNPLPSHDASSRPARVSRAISFGEFGDRPVRAKKETPSQVDADIQLAFKLQQQEYLMARERHKEEKRKRKELKRLAKLQLQQDAELVPAAVAEEGEGEGEEEEGV